MPPVLAENWLCWMLLKLAGSPSFRSWESYSSSRAWNIWRCSDAKLSRGWWGRLLAYGACWPLSSVVPETGEATHTAHISGAVNWGSYRQCRSLSSKFTIIGKQSSSYNVSLAFATEKSSIPAEKQYILRTSIYSHQRGDKKGYFETETTNW